MTAQPLTVVDLVDRMRRGEDGAVRTELSGGALVGSMPAKLDGWSFQTDIRRRVSTELPGINLVTAIVVPLKKLRPTFKNTILVGRSDSNDVCIPHQSVSKLHARLWLRDEEVVIADANG